MGKLAEKIKERSWKQRQRNCPMCQGLGHVRSEAPHGSGRGKAWAVRCECQPQTLEEMEEAAKEECSP